MKLFFQKILEFFQYRYDHTQCVIKTFNTYSSKKSQVVPFKGRSVTLPPGKYSFSCKTPFGYQIRYLDLKTESSLVIKEVIWKKNK